MGNYVYFSMMKDELSLGIMKYESAKQLHSPEKHINSHLDLNFSIAVGVNKLILIFLLPNHLCSRDIKYNHDHIV